jgi:hypothetical protein
MKLSNGKACPSRNWTSEMILLKGRSRETRISKPTNTELLGLALVLAARLVTLALIPKTLELARSIYEKWPWRLGH